MIRAETLAALVQQHHNHRGKGAACTILTVKLEDPTGYGRIVRDDAGFFDRIVEQKDATDEEKKIKRNQFGNLLFQHAKSFSPRLSQVKNDNAQGEYYLTDVPALLREAGEDVAHLSARRRARNRRHQQPRCSLPIWNALLRRRDDLTD